MSYDYATLFDAIVAAVSAPASATERMLRLIDECERQRPHPDWSQIREIGFELDSATLTKWLECLSSHDASGGPFQGLWFGLNNPIVDDAASADIYVCACADFNSDSLDWASRPIGPSPYLHSPTLGAIYRVAYGAPQGLRNDAEYPLVLAYGAIVARCALELASWSGPFSSLRGAAVGFDSGDLLFLGTFYRGRFNANIRGV